MNTISIVVKNNYGREAIYPACENARHFASLCGTVTLSRADIRHIQALGFAVDNITQAVSFIQGGAK